MNKKIIIAAVLMLAVTVLFAACKKDDEYQVSHTVTVGTTTVDIYEDKDGNEYVTNVDGDMIPYTTSSEGFYDNIEDLFTETTTDKDRNSTTATSSTNTASSTTTTTTTTTTQSNPNNSTTTTTEPPTIDFGSANKTPDSVSWDDIVNAGKNQ